MSRWETINLKRKEKLGELRTTQIIIRIEKPMKKRNKIGGDNLFIAIESLRALGR